MNSNQLLEISKKLGIKISLIDGVIKEEKETYENYSQVEKNDASWMYSEINFERKSSSEKENVKVFSNEKEAIKFFFLKVLKRFYFSKVFPADNLVFEMNNIDELKQYFHKLGITDIFYSFNLIRPQEVFGEINHKQMIVSYIDEKKQKKFSTMPMDIDRGIFAMYRLTYSLYLLKMVEKEFLDRKVLVERFDDEDIELFIK